MKTFTLELKTNHWFLQLTIIILLLPITLFSQNTISIGTGTIQNGSSAYPSPYSNYYWSAREQYIIPASEVIAAGGAAGLIQSLAFNVSTSNGTASNQYTIKLGQTSATSLGSAFDTNLTTVFLHPSYTAVFGWNTHLFTNPFYWNGTSNLIIDVCASNSAYTTNTTVYQSATAYPSSLDFHDDVNNLCGTATGTTYNQRPNIQLTFAPKVSLDAGMLSINSPSGSVSPGLHEFKASFKNFGTTAITSATLSCSVDGIIQNTMNWTGNLTAGMTSSSILFDTLYFSAGFHVLKAWISNPNGALDSNKYNDTIIKTMVFTQAMSGNYTIGSSGANFNTINGAISALTSSGISGPVTFNIDSGTYNEQITIPEIVGASNVNRITFQSSSANNSSVIITFSALSSTISYTIFLNGADYITFKNLTIKATGSLYAKPFQLMNGANNNVFEGNKIISSITTLSSISGFYASGQNNYNVLNNNEIIGGFYGIYFYGLSTPHAVGNIFKNNKILSAYSYSIYIYYTDSSEFSNNYINNSGALSSNHYNYINYCKAIKIANNKINLFGTLGMTGLNISYCDSLYYRKSLVANNMIALVGGATRYGINGNASNGIDFYYNSINISGGSLSSGAAFYQSAGSEQRIKNNIFSSNSGGYAYYVSSPNAIIESNYNALYTSQGNLAFWTVAKVGLADLQTASGKDINSINVLPGYVSETDLHIYDVTVNNSGTPIPEVTTDIDGDIRDLVSTDIGADEYYPMLYDAGILAITNPTSSSFEGNHEIKILVKNFGYSIINELKVSWIIDGGNEVSDSGNLYLPIFGMDTLYLSNEYFSAGSHTIKVWTTLLNCLYDVNHYNDTIFSFIEILPNSGITKIPIGSSANPLTVLVETSTCLTANQELNMVNFTFRGNPSAGIGSSSGNIFSANSTDGGTTWKRLQLTNDAKGNRYPSGVIYNPIGNLNSNNSYIITSGPTTESGVWAESFFASRRMDSAYSNVKYLPIYNQELIRNSMQIVNGNVFIVGCSNNTIVLDTVSIYKGVFDSISHSFNWTTTKLKIAINYNTSGYQVNMAWSTDGNIGYFWTIGRDSSYDVRSAQPIIWKTTNAGNSWQKMPIFDFSNLPTITAHLNPMQGLYTSRPFWSPIPDGTVDANGNLHLIGKVRAAFSNSNDSLQFFYSYAISNYNPIFDVYTTANGDWNARLLGKVYTLDVDAANSPINTEWNSRVQAGKTSDGNTIFASWADTDPNITTINLYPNIHLAAWKITNGKQLPQKNVTSISPSTNDCFFHCMSDIILQNNEVYTIPLTETDLGMTDVSPVTHNYLKGIMINSSEFIEPDTTALAYAPTANTEEALSSAMSTQLNGTITPNNALTSVVFQYGLTANYTDSIVATPNNLNGNYPIAVSATLNNLVANQTYHYRVKASNYLGVVYGNDVTFSTVGCGQFFNYSAENCSNNTGTYNDLMTSGTVISTSNFDNANSQPITIGFPFTYNCEEFNQFILNTNGFIKLGVVPPSSDSLFFNTAISNDGGIFNSTSLSDANIIAAFNHDLMAGTSPTEYRVNTSGTAPNRVCTIQFKNVRDKTTTPDQQYENMNFQIKLYETTNIIEFVYGSWTPSANVSAYKFAAVGLKGTANNPNHAVTLVKGSGQAWNLAVFQTSNYDPAGNAFNFGNPPNRPAPDAGRVFRFYPILENDAKVEKVYALAKTPIPYGNPTIISASIKNIGTDTMVNVTATLIITGANTYTTNAVIPYLAPWTSEIVYFAGFSPTNFGTDSIQVVLASDQNNENNKLALLQHVNTNTFSYAEGLPDNGFGSSSEALFLNKYHVNGDRIVSAVNIYLYNYAENIGNAVFAVVCDSLGNVVARSENLVLTQANTNAWYSFSIPNSIVFSNSDFYVGLALTYPIGVAYYPVGIQAEIPSRPNTFYFSNSINGGNISDVAPGWKPMIEAVVSAPPQNDLGVSHIYTFTKLPIPSGNPHTISAIIKNTGVNVQLNKPVILQITGANNFTDTTNIDTLFPGETKTVQFSEFSPIYNGIDTVKVLVLPDDLNSNNSITELQLVNSNTYSYTSENTNLQAWGESVPKLELVKYHISGTKAVTSVKCFIHGHQNNIGNIIYAVVVNNNGNVVARSADFLMSDSNINMIREFQILNPVNMSNTDFYVGFALTAPINYYYWPIGIENEFPGREQTYFYCDSLIGGTLIPYNFNYKFTIDAVVSDPVVNQDIIVGTGTQLNSATSFPSPYGNYYWGNKEQYLIKASELTALGATSGNISNIAFNVMSVNATPILQNFEIKMKLTTVQDLSAGFETGLTPVLSNPLGYQPIIGWNAHALSSPFNWDGVSNILVEVCSNNSNWMSNGNASTYYTTVASNCTRFTQQDAAGTCNITSGGTISGNRPNMKLTMASSFAIDAGIQSLVSPLSPDVAGNHPIKVNLKNYGVNSLNSVQINWRIDNGTIDTITWQGNLQSGQTIDLVIGNHYFTPGYHGIKVWTKSPNNIADDNNSNDTLSLAILFKNPMAGIYYIGTDTNSNFSSFNSAVSALIANGINGSVTFKVKSGIYNEQISIPEITGRSSINTITFESQSAINTDVILQFNATQSINNYVVLLNGADYISFKNLTIKGLNSNFGTAVLVSSGANFNSFIGNNIVASASSSSSSLGISNTNGPNNYNSYLNNSIINGFTGMMLNSTPLKQVGTLIKGNDISGFYQWGIHSTNLDSLNIEANYIHNGSGPTQYAIDIYSSNYYLVSKNKIIINAQGASGYYDNSSYHGVVSNNLISISGVIAEGYGIYSDASIGTEYYYNSININGNCSASDGIYAGNSNGLRLKNNIFVNKASGYAAKYLSFSSFAASDYNLFFTNSSNFIFVNSNLPDLIAFQSASGKDAHSYSFNPLFLSETNLHLNNAMLNGSGTPVVDITDDIDNEPRSLTNPDIGIDEFAVDSFNIAAKTSYVYDSIGINMAPIYIACQFQNIGMQNITSFDYYYSVNNGTPIYFSVTGLHLATFEKYSVSHPIGWTPPSTGTYSIKMWAANVNGANKDTVRSNDTIVKSIKILNKSSQRTPLFEEFVSSTNLYDVAANQNLKNILDSNQNKWTLIKYPSNWPGYGDPYYTTESGTKIAFYGITGNPYLKVDGGKTWEGQPVSFTKNELDYGNYRPAYFDINADMFVNNKACSLYVNIVPYANFSDSNIVLNVGIVETETYKNTGGNGETSFKYIMKKMLPNANGQSLGTITANQPINQPFIYTFNGNYRLPNGALNAINNSTENSVEEFSDLIAVVWLQNKVTKEVYQSAFSSKMGNVTVCKNTGTYFVADAIGASYQWQVNSGAGFSNISNNSKYSGTSTRKIVIQNTDNSMNNYKYRCIAFGTTNDTSSTSTITTSFTQHDTINICANDSVLWHGVYYKNQGTYTYYQFTDCIDSIFYLHVGTSQIANITANGPTTFCERDSVTLTANSGPFNYSWKRNGQTIGITTKQCNPSQSGLYTVLVHDTSSVNNCAYESNSISVTILPSPNAIAIPSGATTFCQGNTLLLSSNNTVGYIHQWMKNGSILSGANNSALLVSASGQYSVAMTNSFGCSDTSNGIAIIVNSKPNVIIIANGPTSFCMGDSVILNNTNLFSQSYQWKRNEVNIPAATNSNYNVKIAGSYKLLLTDSNNCSDTSIAINISVVPIFTSTFSSNNSICLGDTASIIYTGNAPGTATFNWNFSGATVISGSGQGPYSLLYTSPGNKAISLNVTNNSCTSTTQTSNLIVNYSEAVLTPAGSPSICTGDSLLIFANSGNGFSFQWYMNDTLISGQSTSYMYVKAAGNYKVKVTNVFGCTKLSNILNIVIKLLPTSNFTINNSSCLEDTINVVYQGNAPANASYIWNYAGATLTSGSGQGPLKLKYSSTGQKMVSLKVNLNGCLSEVSAHTLVINSTSAIATVVGSTTFCSGDSVTLFGNTGPNLEFQWKNGTNDLLGQVNSFYVAKTSGSYKVKVTNTLTGCSAVSNSIGVTVNSSDFNLSFAASQVNFTTPPFIPTFNNTTPQASNYSFLWSFGDGGTSQAVSPSHQYIWDGNYTVGLFAQNILTGCTDTIVKTNYIHCLGGTPNPCLITATINQGGSTVICQGDSLLLTANVSGAQGPVAYTWFRNGVYLSQYTTASFYAKQNGNYIVVVEDTVCNFTSSALVLGYYNSVMPVINSFDTIQPCSNDSMQLFVTSFFNTYNWSTGQTTPSIYVKQSGNYFVTVTNGNGCSLVSNVYIVNASLLQAPSICIVGVDTANHNRVIWERSNTTLIDSFYVYRETTVANVYQKMGAVAYASPGIFVDNTANPAVRAWRYRITAKDTCGMESPMSSIHKTMHLTINVGLNGSWNLIWDGYQGFNFGSYNIYRGTSATSMNILTQVPSNISSYTDLNPPAGTVYYQLEIVNPYGCYPDSVYAKANTNYNSSRSNTANTGSLIPQYLSADFGADVTQGIWPVQVQFTNLSMGGPNAWKWTFGDGNNSVEEHPKHTYNNTGLYTVRLICCYNTVCDTMEKVNFINVLPNGMVEIYDKVQMQVYPNPAKEKITVELDNEKSADYQLSLFDAYGQRLMNQDVVSPAGKNSYQLDVSTYSEGVYFIILQNVDVRIIRKIIIQ